MRWIWCALLAVVLGFVAAPDAGAQQVSAVSPPITIPSNCSVDVSHTMQHWLRSLAPGSTVAAVPGACYLVDEGLTLNGAQGLTISGGTWKDLSSPQVGASADQMQSVFWLVGGSNLTLENMAITGANPGGYDPSGAFAAGIRSDGVIGLNVENVSVADVYGDGVELAPLRGANDLSNTIVNPSENVTISNVMINGSGRQGITLASVDNASITSVSLKNVGLNVFDIEADQWDEGTRNVLINGCTVGGGNGGLFFANGGLSAGGGFTGNITVENCTMNVPDAGDAVLVQTPQSEPHPRGPFNFVHDSLQCGSSVYVGCVMSTDGVVAIEDSILTVPPGTVHEPVYGASQSSTLSFSADVVSGYGSKGSVDTSSSVTIAGGSWTPFAGAPARTPTPKASALAAVTPTTTQSGASAKTGATTSARSAATNKVTANVRSGPGSGSAPVVFRPSGGGAPDTAQLSWRPLVLGAGAAILGFALLTRIRRRRSKTAVNGVIRVPPSVEVLLGAASR